MKRSDINEIKKLFKINSHNIRRIHGVYVNGEKQIVAQWQQSFDQIEEVEMFKYLDIFKKCLSGNIGRTLYDVNPNEARRNEFYELATSMSQERMDEITDRIIDDYEHVGNYTILAINGVYDIPGRTSDNTDMADASDEVYEYTLLCICPVELSKPGLGYDKDKNTFINIERDWMIQAPDMAFLYPAFNDRSADREAALAYIKSVSKDNKPVYESIFGCSIGEIHQNQTSGFREVLDRVLGPDKSIDDIRFVESKLSELSEIKNANSEEQVMTEKEFEEVLGKAGISPDAISKCADIYREELGDQKIRLTNIIASKSRISTPRGLLTLDNMYTQYLKLMNVNGKKCLVLELDEGSIDMNGIEIKVRSDD